MENGNTAQLSTVPFCLVLVELGIDGLKERTHERDFPCWANDRAFEIEVLHCNSISNWLVYATNGITEIS